MVCIAQICPKEGINKECWTNGVDAVKTGRGRQRRILKMLKGELLVNGVYLEWVLIEWSMHVTPPRGIRLVFCLLGYV